MKDTKYIFSLLALAAVFFSACTPTQPSYYRGLPKEYNLAYQQIYGHFYDSVPYAVVGLDIYSEGLKLDKNRRMKGTGYNLCITDIFVPDSLLAEGEYRSLNTQHSTRNIQPYTFLPGRDYEGTPHGMYLLYVEENKLQTIQLLDSGTFVYRNDSLLFTLYYRNTYGYKATYTCSFNGALIPWVKQ
ncbi:MAG: hypothetical protein IIU10_01000 [Paludibacteraceae bacterium]|nr:hypothetical protein [Paludibacteraceae bacterium]